MTLTKAKTILKHYGVTINSRPDGEYRVNVLGGTPSSRQTCWTRLTDAHR